MALKQLREDAMDLVIVDLDLPGLKGEQLIRRLRDLKVRAKPVVLTVYDDPARISAALESGAFGYLLKGMPTDRIISSLRDAFDGGVPLSSAISLKIVEVFHRRGQIENKLSAHEFAILRLLANGRLSEEIAEELKLAPSTIRGNLSRIYARLHVNTASQAVARFHGAQPRSARGPDRASIPDCSNSVVA